MKGRYLKMKKLMTIALVVMMLLGLMVPVFASAEGGAKWVNCPNGKTLNLRVEPSKNAKVLKKLECGTKVELIPYSNPTAGWTCVRANGKDGWVLPDFRSNSAPYWNNGRGTQHTSVGRLYFLNYTDADGNTVSADEARGESGGAFCRVR